MAEHTCPLLANAPAKMAWDTAAGSASVEHDGRVVPTKFEGHPFEVGRGGQGHLLPGLHRAGKADLARNGMRGHPGAELVAPADDVQDTRGEHVAQELAHLQRGERRVGRGLQHERVAGQEGRSDLPEGQGEREVPRCDRGDHSQRPPGHLDESALIVLDHLGWDLEVGEILAPDGGGEPFDGGVAQGLALLGRERRGELGGRLCHQYLGRLQQRGAARRLVRLPLPGGLGCRVEGGVELLARALGRLGEDLTGGGIAHAEGVFGRRGLPVNGHHEFGHRTPHVVMERHRPVRTVPPA